VAVLLFLRGESVVAFPKEERDDMIFQREESGVVKLCLLEAW
jgi:hypothetical protein